jgi:hypothetical protein
MQLLRESATKAGREGRTRKRGRDLERGGLRLKPVQVEVDAGTVFIFK